MHDPFHEAKEALDVAKREYTSVGSLSVMAAYSVNQACENSVRAIWEKAIGCPFPHNDFRPFHKPEVHVQQIGLHSYYSSETQKFLAKLTGYALNNARYENTQAYLDYIKPEVVKRGSYLIEGTERFISETEQLSTDPNVLKVIQDYEKTLKTK